MALALGHRKKQVTHHVPWGPLQVTGFPKG